jgi:TRAP-type C4-dicarboxylate transport system substrate-binding protein
VKNRIISISLAALLALSVGLIGCGSEEVPEITEYNLTISSTEGGSVTTPDVVTSTYPEGQVADLVATPDEYYHFVNWTGDVGTIADVDDATTTITVNGDYSIRATFELEPWDYTIELSLHCTAPPQASLWQYVYQPWVAEVENATGPDGGRFKFDVTFGSEPWDEPDGLVAVGSDISDVGQLSGDTFHLGSIDYLPFFFPNMASCAYATHILLQSEVEDWDALGELDDVKTLLASPIQPAQWLGNVPVTTLADLAGVRVGCEAGDVPTIEALGATPIEIVTSELADALESGFVDGCFMTYFGGAFAWGLLDVTQYNTEVNLFPMWFFALAMNRAVYEGLHPDARALLDTFCRAEKSAEYAKAHEAAQAGAKSYINDYRASHGQSPIYVLPEEELDNWKAACASVYTDWVDYMDTLTFDGQGIYDRALELIAEYEQGR